jgi:hypothetical protein
MLLLKIKLFLIEKSQFPKVIVKFFINIVKIFVKDLLSNKITSTLINFLNILTIIILCLESDNLLKRDY